MSDWVPIDDPNDPRLSNTPLNEPQATPRERTSRTSQVSDENFFSDLVPAEKPAAQEESTGGGGYFDELVPKKEARAPERSFTGGRGEHRDLVFQSLQDHGVSPVATAAIMGDIEQESSFKPRLSGDGGTSRGLLQVGTPLFRQFEADQASKGIKPDSPDYVYNQTPFVLNRFAQQHPDRWQAMQDADSSVDALKIFRGTKDWGYGIAGKRYDYANAYQQKLSSPEIQRRIAEFPAIAGEVTGQAVGEAGKAGETGAGFFSDLVPKKTEGGKGEPPPAQGLPSEASAKEGAEDAGIFADLVPRQPVKIEEPTPPPEAEVAPPPAAQEEELPSLPTIDLGAPTAAPQQPAPSPQPGLPAPPAEEQQLPVAAPPLPQGGLTPLQPGVVTPPDALDQIAPTPTGELPPQPEQPEWTTGAGHTQLPFGFVPTDDGQMMNVRTGVKVPLQGEARSDYAPLPLQTGAKKAVETGLSYVPPLLYARKLLPETSRIRQGVEATIEGSGALAEGLASPENLALIAASEGIGLLPKVGGVASKAVSAYFAAQMASQLPEQWQALQEAPDFKTKVQIATQALGSLVIAGLATKHAASEAPIPGAVGPTREAAAPPVQPRVEVPPAGKEAPARAEQNLPPGTTEPAPAMPPGQAAAPAPEAPAMGGPGTPGAAEIPEAPVTGLRNAIIDEERAKRGWLPLMRPARKAMGETWDQAMLVLERDSSAGRQMVDDIRDGRKKSVDDVDHAVLTHERIVVKNEAAMEAERASDPHMTEQERNEARARWGVLEDRLNEVDQALRQAGTISGRALAFRNALIRDDYTYDGLARKARAIKGEGLSPEESAAIKKVADEIEKAEEAAATAQVKATEKGATEQAKTELAATRARTARTPKPASLDGQHAKLLTAINEHVKEGGSLGDLRPLVQKLAENYVRRGITKLQPLTRALHETLKKVIPDITPAQVRDLFSGYGDFRPLNKDAIQVQLRDLRGQAQQAGKIKDMIEKVAPRKTGPERRTPTEHERRLLKKVNELKKQGGFTVTDPATQLKSALGAVRTRLKNQLADLTRQLFTGERPTKKGGLEYDVETEKLRTLRDQVKQSLIDVTERPELTDAQRLTAATKAAERNLDYWTDRLKLAKQGVFKIDRETGKPISDPHLDAMKARVTAVKAEIDSLKKIANPLKTPEERALAAWEARIFNRMADLQDRIAKGDFAPRPRKQIVLDKEHQELAAQAARLKRKFDEGVARKRLQDRVWWEKGLDGLSKWRRAFVLSWPTVLGKLTAASSYLVGITPIEELARSPYRVLLPKVAEKAPAFGRGFHLKTEVGAITHTFKTLFSAFGKKIKTGQTDIDALYGDPKIIPPELKDFVSNLHGALKEPARQNEFFRRFQNRLYSAGKAGADVTDPLVQTKIATQAYKDANAQIFTENNMVADFINRGLSRFKQVNKETGRPTIAGKLAETAVKYELPVVKIPLNVIKRTFEYSFGVPTGAVRLAWAMVKGLDKLTPEGADIILRNLSRGKVGLAAMAYGYFNPTQFGGYYQPGEKRAPGDLAAGHARVMGLDIPPYLTHNPLLAQFQIGSTIRRIVDSKATGKHPQSPGYTAAIVQAYAGVIEETPLVRSTQDNLRALNPSERDRFIGQIMQSTVPGVVEWAAKHWDTDANGDPISRKPVAPVEYFKQAVPGLRQDVPRRGQSAGQGSIYAPLPPPPPPPSVAPPPPPPPPL